MTEKLSILYFSPIAPCKCELISEKGKASIALRKYDNFEWISAQN